MTELNVSQLKTKAQQYYDEEKTKIGNWLNKKPDRLSIMQEYYKDREKYDTLNDKGKSILNTVARYYPELFAETKQEEIPLTELEQKQNSALETMEKLGLSGILKNYGKAMEIGAEKGILPDVSNKNFWGILKESAKFPFQKVMDTLSIFPRTEAALTSEVYKNAVKNGLPTISEFNWQDLKEGKYGTYLDRLKSANIGKEGFKNVAKAAFEPLYKADSKYSGTGFAQAYEEIFPDTKFTEPFKGTEGWEEGNWWQRLVSGFAGSPSDVAGFVSDIALDPLTYISGGIIKGAKTGVSLADDLVKGGSKILPKGAEVALSKTGQKAFKEFSESAYPNIFKAIDNGLITPNAVVRGLNATDDTAKQIAKNVLNQKAVNKFLQEIPDAATATNYLDFGGTKFLSKTVIPGYKYAEKFGKLKTNGAVKTFGKIFNENADIPDELRPFKDWLLSAGEAEKSQSIKDFATIVKDANTDDLDKVQKYMWQMADIERSTNKLDDISKRLADVESSPMQKTLFGGDEATKSLRSAQTRVTNLLDKYKSQIDELGLNEKQLGIAENLKNFWSDIADRYTQATGKPLDKYEFYTPIRYSKEQGGITKQSILGAKTQPFEKSRAVTMAQAEGLGLEAKSLVESSMQRLWEQERNVFRSRLLNQAKQFGSETAQKGYTKFDDIPELAGVYLPKEYENVVKNSYNLFFGDESLNKIAKIYDKGLTIWKRWALATPGYHFRNFFTDNVSGLMEYGPSYYKPKYWSDMGKVLKKEHKLITLNGVKRYADDVYKEMLETGEIALTTQTTVEAKLGQLTSGKWGKVENAIKKVSLPEYSLRAGNVRENSGRVIAGLIERDAGASKIMAAANVKKVFFDYAHSLTPFEKNIMTRAMPFYRWLKNNVRRQIQLLFTRTGEYATVPKAMNFVENISETPEGYDEFKPDYYRDLGVMMTPLRQPGLPDWLSNLLNVPKTEEAGNPLAFNPNLAFQDWSRLSGQDMFSALAPQLKAPLELFMDKNVFLNTPIKEDSYGNEKDYREVSNAVNPILNKLPDKLLETLGIMKDSEGKVSIPPAMDYSLQTFSPQYALSQRGFAGTENTPYQNISSILGIKFFPYDENKEKERYTSNWLKEAQNELGKYEQKENTKLPSTTEIESAYREIYKNAVAQDYTEILELKKLLDTVGSNKETDKEIKELLKPYNEAIDKAKGKGLIDLKKLLKEIGIEPTLIDVEKVLAER